MRPLAALTIMTAAMAATCLAGLAPPSIHAAPWLERDAFAGPMDPTVDGVLLQVNDPKPEPATSDGARVAPSPSERKEPAAPDTRQTPAGGQTEGTRDGAEPGNRHE